MYANRPAKPDHRVDDQPTDQRSTQSAPERTHAQTPIQPSGPTPAAEVSGADLARVLQGLPYLDMYTFCLALARDLLHRDDADAVKSVADALIATAQVWHTAE